MTTKTKLINDVFYLLKANYGGRGIPVYKNKNKTEQTSVPIIITIDHGIYKQLNRIPNDGHQYLTLDNLTIKELKNMKDYYVIADLSHD